jgi:hypothetical protein
MDPGFEIRKKKKGVSTETGSGHLVKRTRSGKGTLEKHMNIMLLDS